MGNVGAPGVDLAAELRQAFDASFAQPAIVSFDDREVLLDVLVGTAPYAIRVSDIRGLVADVKVAPLSTAVHGLLGVAGVRGAIVAVYDLASFLGQGESPSIPRWMVIGRTLPIGLAFHTLSGHLLVDRPQVVRQVSGTAHVQEVALLNGRTTPIVALASIADSVTSRVDAAAGRKE
jgi:chemotaxis signal transduction protein